MKPRSQEHKDKIRLALMGRETKPVEERFYSKVRIDLNGCWNWTGAIKPNGYGSFNIKRYNTSKTFNTHRWSYEYLKGPIPEELTLDHL